MFEMTQHESLKEQFLDVLTHKRIKTVFQPIISLRDGSVYGYEALSRGPQDSQLQSPETLFQCAEKYDKLWDFELLCRSKALKAANELVTNQRIFLNVNPNIMNDKKFRQGFTRECLYKYSVDPQKIVFEITEREAIKNISAFIKTVQNYKDQKYKIAIDDTGAGYSGLNLISDIRPHYIKLDMNLIRNIDKDVTKQSLVKSMCEFSSLTNTFLVAEGIETENELLRLIEIGVHYGQGYFIQRPNGIINPIDAHITGIIIEANRKKNHFYGSRVSDVYISNICRSLRTIHSNILVSQVNEMMESDRTLPGFCITENDEVVGVITRNELYKHISGKYGYNLYANKPIKHIMSKEYMCIDYKNTIDIVAKKAMQRDMDKIYDFITITKENKYLGIVTVKELLEKSIELEVNNAKHLNPLSELPGNLLIERQLEKCLYSKNNFIILYFDIDNFKAYNDVYGFENGDRVLKNFTEILRNNLPVGNFTGHIGGDDFIAVIKENLAEETCKKVIEEFDKSVMFFYNQDDMDKGFIITKNRYGVEESVPLLSLSIAGVSSRQYETIYNLAEDAGKLKKICKQKVGSNYMLIHKNDH